MLCCRVFYDDDDDYHYRHHHYDYRRHRPLICHSYSTDDDLDRLDKTHATLYHVAGETSICHHLSSIVLWMS